MARGHGELGVVMPTAAETVAARMTLAEASVIGFDVDGTLVRSWTSDLLPGVRDLLAAISPETELFIATNQSGPVWRALTGKEKYPSADDVVAKLTAIAGELFRLREAPLLIATSAGGDCRIPGHQRASEALAAELSERLEESGIFNGPVEVSAEPSWRKPGPGMLAKARELCGQGALVFVGDMPADHGAAEAAGATFVDAAQWRGRAE